MYDDKFNELNLLEMNMCVCVRQCTCIACDDSED